MIMPNLNHCLNCDRPYVNDGVMCIICIEKYKDINKISQQLEHRLLEDVKKEANISESDT
tara:strand:+ start:1828 stop:2007 length:180 start_codon:yes stop_codon:yes gene_type:complete